MQRRISQTAYINRPFSPRALRASSNLIKSLIYYAHPLRRGGPHSDCSQQIAIGLFFSQQRQRTNASLEENISHESDFDEDVRARMISNSCSSAAEGEPHSDPKYDARSLAKCIFPKCSPECSLNVPWMFPECSLNVPWMFLECSLKVPCRPDQMLQLKVPWLLCASVRGGSCGTYISTSVYSY